LREYDNDDVCGGVDAEASLERVIITRFKFKMQSAVAKVASRLGMSPQIAWEGSWSFALKTVYTGLTFITTMLLARLMGAAEYGVYAYAYALMMLVTLPTQAGLPNLIVRETARGMVQNRPDLVQGVWRWSGRVVGVISLALVMLTSLALLLWRDGLSSAQGLTFAWALALVPVIALGNLRGAALRGLKKIVAGQLPEFVIRPALFGLLLMWGGLLADWGLSAPVAMALHVSAALIALLAGAWMLLYNTPVSVHQAVPAIEGRVWLTSCMLFALIVGFQVINKELSTVVLGFFEPSEQVGIYRVAVQVSTLASFGLQAVNLVVAPRFVDLYTQGKISRLQQLVTGSARVVLGFNLIITALFVLVGKPFFGLLFGPDFAASYCPMLILLVGQMVNSAAGSVGFLLNMTGHERDTAQGMASAAIINIALNLMLIPLWGIIGAAVATAISTTVWNVLLCWKVHIKLGINSLAFSFPENRA
jgi:O-antigen/teichoic acid export membrane protein